MVDSIQERIKKQKEEAEKRAQEQAKSGALPSTPGGVAGLGATADQAKMAGTPNAKIGTATDTGEAPPAVVEPSPEEVQPDAAMKDVSQDDQLQTELGEKTFDDQTRDAVQERAAKFSQDMAAFGSLGQRVENMVTGAFSGVTAEGDIKNLAKDVGFEISDVNSLIADGTSEEDMHQLLSDFSDIGREDADAAFQLLVDNQHKFKNPHSGIMSFVDAAYKKDPATMHKTVANLVANDIIDPDQVNFEHLINSGFVNVDDTGTIVELGLTTDELQDILGNDWMNLTPDEIGAEVEKSREELLDNKVKIEKQLADPDIPPQTRAALLDELKRMGAIGAVEYEQRAAEAQTEAADAGKILVGGEVQDVAELLKDEEIKTDVVNFLADPDSEANQEWKRLNPEFANWLERELESLNVTKETLEENIGNFTGIQKHNEDFVEKNLASRGGRLNSDIMSKLGYGDQAFEIENYQAGDDPIYDMLSTLGEGGQTRAAVDIMNRLPKSQLHQLKGLPPNKLKTLLTDSNKMEEFVEMAGMRDKWASVRASGNVDAMADMLLGGGRGNRSLDGAGSVKKRMADLFVQSKLGGNPEVTRQYDLMKTLFDADGNGHIDNAAVVKEKIDALLSKEGDLTGMVDRTLGGRISDFRTAGDTGYDSNLWRHMGQYFGAGDTTISDADLNELTGKLDLHTMSQLKDPKLAGVTNPAKVDFAMRRIADREADKAGAGFPDPSVITGGVGNTSHTEANETVKSVKGARDQLRQMAETGHPYEREAANARLSHILRTISHTPKDLSTAEYNSSRDDIGNSIRKHGLGDMNSLPSHVRHYFGNGIHPDIVKRYAVWRNYADDPSDIRTFFNNMDGRL